MKITIDIDGQEKTFDIPTESDRAEAWEKRCEELEQENRDLKEHWEYARQTRAEACEARADLEKECVDLNGKLDGLRKENADLQHDHREMLDRIAELEQELRDTQEKLDKSVGRETRLKLEADQLRHRAEELKSALDKRVEKYDKEIKELRDQQAVNAKICDMRETVDGEQKKLIASLQERIQEQDVTIAIYDDENRKLRRVLGVYEIPVSIMDEADSVYAEARGIGKAFRCWAGIIHDNAVEHGWWDDERSFGDIVALCHSELSEALEEYRNGKPMSYVGENGKPEGVAVEMIDCIIRILDWCGKESINVDGLLAKKHDYNKGRPYRHEGKKL